MRFVVRRAVFGYDFIDWNENWPPPKLSEDSIHIWIFQTDWRLQGESLCSRDWARAGQFRRTIDRDRWITCREILRQILASYLQKSPRAIEFAYNTYGKPSVANILSAPVFNLTHSEDIALLALYIKEPIGIDVEYCRYIQNFEISAHLFLAPSEYLAWQNLLVDRRINGYYKSWTSKEAVLKALGMGLNGELKSISVSVDPDMQAELIGSHFAHFDIKLITIPLPDFLSGTLAMPNISAQLLLFHYVPKEFTSII